MRSLVVLAIALWAMASLPALAWDPIGDITHPDRIIRNAGRELSNVGRQIDDARREAMVQANWPLFQQWLLASRSSASRGGVSYMPPAVQGALQGFYGPDVLNGVTFKIGDSGVFNLAQLSTTYGGASAVTLVDLIVFKNGWDAFNNYKLWAHELKHVQQFKSWGTRDFAIRYLRSWNSVEGEAYAAENQYMRWRTGAQSQSVAQVCRTPWGYCPMGVQIAVGTACYCPSMQGQLQGVGM